MIFSAGTCSSRVSSDLFTPEASTASSESTVSDLRIPQNEASGYQPATSASLPCFLGPLGTRESILPGRPVCHSHIIFSQFSASQCFLGHQQRCVKQIDAEQTERELCSGSLENL